VETQAGKIAARSETLCDSIVATLAALRARWVAAREIRVAYATSSTANSASPT